MMYLILLNRKQIWIGVPHGNPQQRWGIHVLEFDARIVWYISWTANLYKLFPKISTLQGSHMLVASCSCVSLHWNFRTRLQSCTIAVSSIPCLAHPRVQTKGWVCANMCQYTPRISWRCRISSKDIHPWPFHGWEAWQMTVWSKTGAKPRTKTKSELEP